MVKVTNKRSTLPAELSVAIVNELGGTGKVAAIFEITKPSVSGWKKKGIPKDQWRYIKLAYIQLKSVQKAILEGY